MYSYVKSSINFIIKVCYNLLSVEITHYIKQDMKILGLLIITCILNRYTPGWHAIEIHLSTSVTLLESWVPMTPTHIGRISSILALVSVSNSAQESKVLFRKSTAKKQFAIFWHSRYGLKWLKQWISWSFIIFWGQMEEFISLCKQNPGFY